MRRRAFRSARSRSGRRGTLPVVRAMPQEGSDALDAEAKRGAQAVAARDRLAAARARRGRAGREQCAGRARAQGDRDAESRRGARDGASAGASAAIARICARSCTTSARSAPSSSSPTWCSVSFARRSTTRCRARRVRRSWPFSRIGTVRPPTSISIFTSSGSDSRTWSIRTGSAARAAHRDRRRRIFH